MSDRPHIRQLAGNRKAFHEYHIHERLEAGLVLTGTEVKAARAGNVQLKDGYVEFRGGDAFLMAIHISPYSHGNRENHEPERPRKLLLNRREIDRFAGRSQAEGHTVVEQREGCGRNHSGDNRADTQDSESFSEPISRLAYGLSDPNASTER